MESCYFVVIGTDRPGAHALREQLRPKHREWLREHPGHPIEVLHGGPTLAADGSMDGTVLIVRAPDANAVQEFMAADPYTRRCLFAEVSIRRWAWTLGQKEN